MPNLNEVGCLGQFLEQVEETANLLVSNRHALSAGRLRRLIASHGHWAEQSRGRKVCVTSTSPLKLAFLFLLLDGRAGSILVMPSDLGSEEAGALLRDAAVDILVSDEPRPELDVQQDTFRFTVDADDIVHPHQTPELECTDWIVPTSGTTGTPKLVCHTLETLTRSIRRVAEPTVSRWGLLYDLARFAGLQVFFQAFLTASPLILTRESEPLRQRIEFLVSSGCNSLSATPTLWRKLLMSDGTERLQLRQITLGGEIADRGTLAALAKEFPAARITHIFASTEAGVGFSVQDGQEGFPEDYLTDPPKGVQIAVNDEGFLLLRAEKQGQYFLGRKDRLDDDHGWVNTGDLVELEGSRFRFLGRANGAINVGGNKVFPEAVERVILDVPGVAMALVKGRRNPITGSVVEAWIVPTQEVSDPDSLTNSVQKHCRNRLAPFKVPAVIHIEEALPTAATGKLCRD